MLSASTTAPGRSRGFEELQHRQVEVLPPVQEDQIDGLRHLPERLQRVAQTHLGNVVQPGLPQIRHGALVLAGFELRADDDAASRCRARRRPGRSSRCQTRYRTPPRAAPEGRAPRDRETPPPRGAPRCSSSAWRLASAPRRSPCPAASLALVRGSSTGKRSQSPRASACSRSSNPRTSPRRRELSCAAWVSTCVILRPPGGLSPKARVSHNSRPG